MQTGIKASPEFLQQWASIRANPTIGYIKIAIVNEAFSIVAQGEVNPHDRDNFITARSVLQDKQVCFVVVRTGEQYALVFYVPENSRVADKMTYAGSLSRLKADLMWNDFIGKEIYATSPSECEDPRLTASASAAAAVIAAETTRAREAAYESSHIGYANEVKLTADLDLGVDEKLHTALAQIRENALGGLILSIDVAKETILVEQEFSAESNDETLLDKIRKALPADSPRYVLYNLTGTGHSASKRATAFIYYCPDKGPHRPRMVYSATKGTALRHADVDAYAGKSVFVRVQTNDANEISLADIRKQAFGASDAEAAAIEAANSGSSALANATTLNRPKVGQRAGGLKKLGSGIEF